MLPRAVASRPGAASSAQGGPHPQPPAHGPPPDLPHPTGGAPPARPVHRPLPQPPEPLVHPGAVSPFLRCTRADGSTGRRRPRARAGTKHLARRPIALGQTTPAQPGGANGPGLDVPPPPEPLGGLPAVIPPGALTLQQAVDLALAKNPTLLAARENLRSVRAQEIQAAVRQNPYIGLERRRTSPRPNTSTTRTALTFGVGRLFERGQKRRWRIDSARTPPLSRPKLSSTSPSSRPSSPSARPSPTSSSPRPQRSSPTQTWPTSAAS